jgi:hypothetical protein
MNTLAQINSSLIEFSNSNSLPYEYFDYKNTIIPRLTENNESIFNNLESFRLLKYNWDSYGASKPNGAVIKKAIDLLIWLNTSEIEIYFTAPTRDGDILLEIQNGDKSIEFVISDTVDDSISLISIEESVESKFYYAQLHKYIQYLNN